VVNSVVKGDARAFEVPLSDIGSLYFTCNSGRSRADLVFCKLVPMNSEYMIKKELGVYLRVLGSSDQKTDLDITLLMTQSLLSALFSREL